FRCGQMSVVARNGRVAVQKRGLDHQYVGVANVIGQVFDGRGIPDNDKFLASLWRPEDVLGIDCSAFRERAAVKSWRIDSMKPIRSDGWNSDPTDLIQRTAPPWRASRRMAAGTTSLVAVLRDARKSALLWTRLMSI